MINEKVVHKKFGEGAIVAVEGEMITIAFRDGKKKLQIPLAFEKGFLQMVDEEKQKAYLAEIEEEKRKVAERKAAEKAKVEEEKTKLKNQQVSKSKAIKRKSEPVTRKDNERMYFYVFQGSSYQTERDGGYIWAPIENEKGQTMHHWERMLDVQPGDIVLHGFDGTVAAISVAKGKAYPAERPLSYGDGDWIGMGRKIDLDYHVLKRPLPTKDFIDDIKEFADEKYSPFNRNGTGNMGYLFTINPELVKVFTNWIVKYNSEIGSLEGISDL